MLGALATTLLNLTDTAFMARVGQGELAAMALASIFHFVLFMIGYSLSTGAQILIARRAGEGNIDEISLLFSHSTVLLGLIAGIVAMISYFFSPAILEAIISSDLVRANTTAYVQARSPGLFIAVAGLSFRSFFVGIGRTNIITISSAAMVVINILLDFKWVLGYWGSEPMGIQGAAYASAVAESAFVMITGSYALLSSRFSHYQLHRWFQLTGKRFSSIINISSPIILQNLLSMIAWFLFFILIEKMGERELAISNLVRAVYMVLMTPIWGYASAANSMVSNVIGQGRYNDIRTLVGRIIKLCLATTMVIALADYLSGTFLLNMTSGDAGLIRDALGSYHVILVAMVVFSIGVILLSAVSGSGNTRAAMIIEFINIGIYVLYVYFCTVSDASIEIIWTAEITYWLLMGILSLIYFKLFRWKDIKI